MSDVKEYICQKTERLDTFLASQIAQTRSQIAQLIKHEAVSVDNKLVARPGVKLKVGQKVHIVFPEAKIDQVNSNLLNEVEWAKNVEIIFEDDDVLVINKPSGVTVHPAPSVNEPT
ncbi:MAG: S4 domain-containing protein, partial [Sulfurimonas sp.]